MKKLLLVVSVLLIASCTSKDKIFLPDLGPRVAATEARLDLLEANDVLQDARLDALELNVGNLRIDVDGKFAALAATIATNLQELDDRLSGELALTNESIGTILERILTLEGDLLDLNSILGNLSELIFYFDDDESDEGTTVSDILMYLLDESMCFEESECSEGPPDFFGCYVELRNFDHKIKNTFADIYLVCERYEKRLRKHAKLQGSN